MEKWTLKREVSAGDLLAVIVAVIAALSAYFVLTTRIALVEQRMTQQEQLRAADTSSVTANFNDLRRTLERLVDRLDRYLEKK